MNPVRISIPAAATDVDQLISQTLSEPSLVFDNWLADSSNAPRWKPDYDASGGVRLTRALNRTFILNTGIEYGR